MQVSPHVSSQSSRFRSEYQRRLTRKGGVTLPIEVRRILGVDPRGEVCFRVHDHKVELSSPAMTFEQTLGSVPCVSQPLDFKKMRDIAIEEHVQRVVVKLRQ